MPLSFAEGQTIWLIDDHPPLHHLVKAALEDLNYAGSIQSLYTLDDAEQALHHAFQASQFPDLVLLDINLKGQDGLLFLKKMKQRYKNLPFPVVIFSSSDRMEEMVVAYEFGAQAYVVKPFHFEVMLQFLRGISGFFLHKDYSISP